MTPEQQRIALAEWCGWKFKVKDHHGLWWINPKDGLEIHDSHGPPHYLNDLDAMHEAESRLSSDECLIFERILVKQFDGVSFTNGPKSWMWHATAAQRAEALLRTIGKWVDP